MIETIDNENLEIRMLLEAIYLKYGYDFRTYAPASIKRRTLRRLEIAGLSNVSEMLHLALNDKAFFETLLLDYSINVTEMFRDPSFFAALRRRVLPALKEQPFIRIWHAGCATGEEVYSMAIMLRETGLYSRARIYATDFNQVVLEQAKEGIFSIKSIRQYTANYQKAGGTESFADYYTADYDSVIMDKGLKENMVFANHNLVTDGVFGEMDAIVCRNVLIYFKRELQDRVLRLFSDSLRPGGFLCIGSKESLRFSQSAGDFEEVDNRERVYRKIPKQQEDDPPPNEGPR